MYAQGFARGDQQPQLGAGAEQDQQLRGGYQEIIEVVEHEDVVLIPHVPLQVNPWVRTERQAETVEQVLTKQFGTTPMFQ